jgi:DNA-binding SARP family transcriptional activator
LDYRILGPLEVVDAGSPLPLGGPKQRSLLALLLLHANEVVSTDDLIDRLWGERPPATAAKVLQVQVWRLRKVLGDRALVTRSPGYVLRVDSDDFDLARFERLVGAARGREPAIVAGELRDALALWRGPPLADLAYEAGVAAEIARLDELRVVAIEERIEADLALSRHAELVSELETLVAAHPLREGLRGQLMLALYRSGRQAEALEVYRRGRALLVEELGLEPSPPLQELERAILAQDPELDAPRAATPAPAQRAILVASSLDSLQTLLSLVEPLAAAPGHELILAGIVGDDERPILARIAAALNSQREQLATRGVSARAAAFTSAERGADLVRLASEQDVDLLVVDAPPDVLRDEVPRGELGAVLLHAPCDVALLAAEDGRSLPAGPVIVPFGAARDDWAALELGAWIARAHGAPLRLVGSVAGETRDASRLLADASLVVQRTAGVPAEPMLAEPGPDGLLAAAERSRVLVIGLSERWQREGLGVTRLTIAERAAAPVLFVRRGPRPGGLAPPQTRTHFTWSVARDRKIG